MEKTRIDLALFDARPGAEEGRWLTLRDPESGKDLPVRIRLKGADSQAWRDTHLEQRRRRLDEMEKSGRARIDPAQADAEDIERLVAVTVQWEGIDRNGAEWPCTPANVRELYVGWPEFRAQVVAFLATRANFLPRSASGS